MEPQQANLYNHQAVSHPVDLHNAERRIKGGESQPPPCFTSNDCPLRAFCVDMLERVLHAILMGKFTRVAIATEPSDFGSHSILIREIDERPR